MQDRVEGDEAVTWVELGPLTQGLVWESVGIPEVGAGNESGGAVGLGRLAAGYEQIDARITP